jgi:hypothetical protein
MAIVYNRHKYNTAIAAYDMSAAGTAFKVMLLTSSYTPNADHDTTADLSGEITNSGYTAGGATLASKTVTLDDANDRAYWDAADVTWTSLAGSPDTPAYAVVYHSASGDLVSCHSLTGSAPNGTDFTLTWSASGIVRAA